LPAPVQDDPLCETLELRCWSLFPQYKPCYPHRGDIQHVLGVLSPTYHQTVHSITQYIPHLANVDVSRLLITLPSEAWHQHAPPQSCVPQESPIVTADVWASVMADAPERLGVVLVDSPEDDEAKRVSPACAALIVRPNLTFRNTHPRPGSRRGRRSYLSILTVMLTITCSIVIAVLQDDKT
jgi:hypothetical protein